MHVISETALKCYILRKLFNMNVVMEGALSIKL